MDGKRFDKWIQSFSGRLSRRRFLAKAFVGTTAAMALSDTVEAQGSCFPVGESNPAGCEPEFCCTGVCLTLSGMCCTPDAEVVTGQCGVDGYGCCSGYCDQTSNVCCRIVGWECTRDEECCGYAFGTTPGSTIGYCDLTTRTCQVGVTADQPPGGPLPGEQLPPPGPENDPPSLPLLVKQISTARSSVNAVVAQLKASADDPTLNTAQRDYGTTKAGFDGWLDGFKTALNQGTDMDDIIISFEQDLGLSLQQAVMFVERYQYSEAGSVSGGGPSNQSPVQAPVPSAGTDSGEVSGGGGWGTIATTILTNLPTLIESGKAIFDMFQAAEQAERDKILADLESLRWLPWANIV